jgi:hypothetical protein
MASTHPRCGSLWRLSTDHTSANYLSIFQNLSDGVNPVMFDTDGSIIDAVRRLREEHFSDSPDRAIHVGTDGRSLPEGRGAERVPASRCPMTTVLAQILAFLRARPSQLDDSQSRR